MAEQRRPLASDYIKNGAKDIVNSAYHEVKNNFLTGNLLSQNNITFQDNNPKNNINSDAIITMTHDLKGGLSALNQSMSKMNDAVLRGNEISWQVLSKHTQTNLLLGKLIDKMDKLNQQSNSSLPDIPSFPTAANENTKNNIKGGTQKAAKVPKFGAGLALLGAGITGFSEYQDSGDWKKAGTVAAGSGAGAWGGAVAGAAGGALLGPFGAAAGGLIGGIAGGMGGEWLSRKGYESFKNDAPKIEDIKDEKSLPNQINKENYSITTDNFNITTKNFKINGVDLTEAVGKSSGVSGKSVSSNSATESNYSYNPQKNAIEYKPSSGNVPATPNSKPGFGYAPGMAVGGSNPASNSNSGRGATGGMGGMPSKAVQEALDFAAKELNLDPKILYGKASIESNFNPNASAGRMSSARGLGQFLEGTWKEVSQYPEASKYGITGDLNERFDPKKAAIATGLYSKKNIEKLKGEGLVDDEMLKKNPSLYYLPHNLGPEGSRRFLQGMKNNPNGSVSDVLTPKEIQNNPSVYMKNGKVLSYQETLENLQAGKFGKGMRIKDQLDKGNESKSGQYDIEGGWHAPADGRIGSQYGDSRNNGSRQHMGTDIRPVERGENQTIYSAGQGKVTAINEHGDVTLQHKGKNGENIQTVYRHMDPTVKIGDEIKGGQNIGSSRVSDPRFANAGAAGGRHLHFETLVNGQKINPGDVIPSLGSRYEKTGAMLKGGQPFINPDTMRRLSGVENQQLKQEQYANSPFTNRKSQLDSGSLQSFLTSKYNDGTKNPYLNADKVTAGLFGNVPSFAPELKMFNKDSADTSASAIMNSFGVKNKNTDNITKKLFGDIPDFGDKSSNTIDVIAKKAMDDDKKSSEPIIIDRSNREDNKEIIREGKDDKSDKNPSPTSPSRDSLKEYFYDFTN